MAETREEDHEIKSSSPEVRAAWINSTAVVLAAVIGAGATVLVGVLLARSGDLPDVLFPPQPTSTVTVTVTATPEPPPTNAPGTRFEYLDSIDTVEGGLEPASITWGESTFPHSLTNPLSGCSAQGPVDWVVPSDAVLFVAEIGVTADSVEPDSRVTFNVFVDGVLQDGPQTLGVGEHTRMEVDVQDKGRIRLESVIDQSRRNNCNTEAVAVWGDAAFVVG